MCLLAADGGVHRPRSSTTSRPEPATSCSRAFSESLLGLEPLGELLLVLGTVAALVRGCPPPTSAWLTRIARIALQIGSPARNASSSRASIRRLHALAAGRHLGWGGGQGTETGRCRRRGLALDAPELQPLVVGEARVQRLDLERRQRGLGARPVRCPPRRRGCSPPAARGTPPAPRSSSALRIRSAMSRASATPFVAALQVADDRGPRAPLPPGSWPTSAPPAAAAC